MAEVHEKLTTSGLQDRLKHRFAQPQLLELALTHRSFSSQHNERLEFLGDSVLNLAVSRMLFIGLRDQPEGDLSRVRANLVKQDTLHRLALDLGLSGLIRLGEGEMRSATYSMMKSPDRMRDSVRRHHPLLGSLNTCSL